MAIRRELVAAQPDSFRPNLAMSLSVLADCLESLSRLNDALESDEEAVRTLGPMFLSAPAHLLSPMTAIARDYLRRLQALNRQPQPDLADLLAQIVAVFNPQIPIHPMQD